MPLFLKWAKTGFIILVKTLGESLNPWGSDWNAYVVPWKLNLKYFMLFSSIGMLKLASFKSNLAIKQFFMHHLNARI